MALYITPSVNGQGAPSAIFNSSPLLSNITAPYCSYYTSGSRLATADLFLSNINFPAVYANVKAGASNIIRANTPPKTFTKSPEFTSYMSNLQGQMQSLAFVANCVTEQTDPTDALYSAKKQLETSKDRYDELHSPETRVSYYEGTFPIYRPVGQTTLFVLFGTGLFLMLLSLLCFMKTQGIELQLIIPASVVLPGTSISSLFAGNYAYIGIACLAGIVLGYFLHVYT
jgi:hypothetical protein